MNYFRVFMLVMMCQVTYAQTLEGGGALPVPKHGTDREHIEKALTRARINSEKLKRTDSAVVQADPSPTLLKWPMRKAIIVTDPGIEAIANFLDQDPSEAGILDFDCGDRTYDGHNGVDINTTPFSWYKMELDHGIVVAAAPGKIVEKVNDQPERSCTTDSGESNTILIEHQDGSLAIYAHMRTGSLTAKAIGATVSTGEYLGVVGSSGLSTGPHLHFEVGFWEQNGNVWTWKPRDPYAGVCNDLNVDSWWEEQPGYFIPTLNAVATHDQPPDIPACPETEIPHYQDSFMAGDTVYIAAYYRDQLKDQNSHLKVTMPDGSTALEWDHASSEEHYSSSYWTWSFALQGNSPSGEWTFSVTFEEQTVTHKFYVDALAPPAPTMPASNNAYNGTWYDPSLDGEGYNIVTADAGTVIYYYGNDVEGKRMWLISEVVEEVLANGKEVRFLMYESTGGTHASPNSSARGLSAWGELIINFTDCNNGTAILRGIDGEKNTNILKIVGVSGTNCVGQASEDGPMSGVWFDFAFDGEGFNLIVTPIGVVIYYYGFDMLGNRLWFISDVMAVTLQAGQQVNSDLYKATVGTFSEPVPSDQALSKWGTVTIDVINCSSLTITMDTAEGLKVSQTIKIVGVVGLTCVD